MVKVAFLFSGQGAQYVGMGKDLYQNCPTARSIFDMADNVLGYKLSELCFAGPKEDLDKTENTQPAILTVSVAACTALVERGIKPDVVAGLSLGEYSALVCSNVLPFAEGVRLVRKRGLFMQEAVPQGIGGMIAVLGMDTQKVEDACRALRAEGGMVFVVNYNCPGQLVISGTMQSLEAAKVLLAQAGGKRFISLGVSGPFHTELLLPAAEKLAAEIAEITLGEPQYPLIANVSGDYIVNAAEVSALLPKQVMSPVLWEKGIRRILDDGADTFIEIGPGSALRGFMKKIATDKEVRLLHVEDMASLEETIASFVKT